MCNIVTVSESVIGLISLKSLTALSTLNAAYKASMIENMKQSFFHHVRPSIALFDNFSPHSLAKLAAKAQLLQYAENEFIYHKDDAGSCFYIILQGEVENIVGQKGYEDGLFTAEVFSR